MDQQPGQNGEKRPGIGGLSLRQPCFSLRKRFARKKSLYCLSSLKSSRLARKTSQRTTRISTHRHIEVLSVRHGGGFGGENRQSPARRRAAESSEAARDRVRKETVCACARSCRLAVASDFGFFSYGVSRRSDISSISHSYSNHY